MSQVKNLRAMFENKGDDPSPPERGRSPAGFPSNTVPGDSASESPRPLSTVRTNFVAIQEKNGRMGLRRHPSHESASPSRRPMSTDMESESVSTPGDDLAKPSGRRLFVDDPILESPQSTRRTGKTGPSEDLAEAVDDGPSHGPDIQVDEEQPSAVPTPTEPPRSATSRNFVLTSKDADIVSKVNTTERKLVDTRIVPTSKPVQTSTTAKTTTKNSIQGGTPTTTTTKPVTSTNKKDTVVKKEAIAGTKLSATTTKSSSMARKPAPVKVHNQGTGFFKPKVKSPTKPVALPSSLMAPTASSVSKRGDSKPTNSRQIGSLQPQATARAPSRASAAGGSGTKVVRRQPSTITSSNSSRPSIGPPPKKFGQDGQPPKKESQVDEGFLARMMRPTQASSSKTNEKAPATPPRKSVARASASSASASSRRGSSIKRQSKLGGSAGDVAVSSNVSEAEPSVVAEDQHEVLHSPAGALNLTEDVVPSTSGGVAFAGEHVMNDPDAVADVEQPTKQPLADLVTKEEVALKTAHVETAEEMLGVPEEVEGPVRPCVEPSETTSTWTAPEKSGKPTNPVADSPEPDKKMSPDAALLSTELPIDTSLATQAVEHTFNSEASVEAEDGRTAQAVIDEKEEAAMAVMTPSEDVIPEKTGAVETAEEVAALAEAGDLVQPLAVSDAFRTGGKVGIEDDDDELLERKDGQDMEAA